MGKNIITYWNPLSSANRDRWQPIKGLEKMAEELTLSIDNETGEYTRLRQCQRISERPWKPGDTFGWTDSYRSPSYGDRKRHHRPICV